MDSDEAIFLRKYPAGGNFKLGKEFTNPGVNLQVINLMNFERQIPKVTAMPNAVSITPKVGLRRVLRSWRIYRE